MSCIGLSIIFRQDIISCISTEFKYSVDVSLYTGIPKSEISFSYIGDNSVVDLNSTTISLYVTFL